MAVDLRKSMAIRLAQGVSGTIYNHMLKYKQD